MFKPSVVVDIIVKLLNCCVTGFHAFNSLQAECRSFRVVLLALKGFLLLFKANLASSSRDSNSKMQEPLRLLINAVKDGKDVLEACTNAKKVRTLVFSRDYLSKLDSAANNINSALTLLTAARSCGDDSATQRKVDDVNRSIKTLKRKIQENNHEAEAIIFSLAKAKFPSARGFDVMLEKLRSLDIVNDTEELREQLREIQRENSELDEKSMYNQELLKAILVQSRQESEGYLPHEENYYDNDDSPTTIETFIEISPEPTVETDVERKIREQQSNIDDRPSLNETLPEMSASIATNTSAERRAREQQSNIESLLSCPLSLDIMNDPVVLSESGTTYDREYLCKSLLAHPNLEPYTNERFDNKLSFTSNMVVRRMLMETYGDQQYQPYDDSNFHEQYEEAWQAHYRRLWSLDDIDNGIPTSQFALGSNLTHTEAQACPVLDIVDASEQNGNDGQSIPFAQSTPVYYDLSSTVPSTMKTAPEMTTEQKRKLYAELADILFEADIFESSAEKAQQLLQQASRDDAIFEAYRGLLLGKVNKEAMSNVESFWRNSTNLGLDVLATTGDNWARILKAAQFHHGFCERCDYRQAARLFQESVDDGIAVAQYCLGYLYEKGLGVDQDFRNALDLYTKATEQGNLSAKCSLASMYLHGQGCSKNEEEAFINFWFAAEEGHSVGQYQLGMLYEKGLGTPVDCGQAEIYYRLSIDQGNHYAMNQMGLLYFEGAGCMEKDITRAVTLLQRAAELGNPDALYKIGTLYFKGSHVEKNVQAAIESYEKSAAADHGGSMQKLAELYDRGEGVEKDKEKANELYKMAVERGYEGKVKRGVVKFFSKNSS